MLAVRWHPTDQRLATVDRLGVLRIWDAINGELLRKVDTEGGLNSVDWSPDGTRLAVGGYGLKVLVWDAENEAAPLELVGHTEAIFCVRWHPNRTRIASCDSSGMVRVWDVDRQAAVWSQQMSDAVWRVAWSPDGRQLSTAHFDGTMRRIRRRDRADSPSGSWTFGQYLGP